MSERRYDFNVRTPEGRTEMVTANTVQVTDDRRLVFYDSDGIKAQFSRWEHYVRMGHPSG